MLRSAQMILSTALIFHEMGRDWRLIETNTLPPTIPNPQPDQSITATSASTLTNHSTLTSNSSYLVSGGNFIPSESYVHILSWFLDRPSVLSPYSLHNFLEFGQTGKKKVGEWFGPHATCMMIQRCMRRHVNLFHKRYERIYKQVYHKMKQKLRQRQQLLEQ